MSASREPAVSTRSELARHVRTHIFREEQWRVARREGAAWFLHVLFIGFTTSKNEHASGHGERGRAHDGCTMEAAAEAVELPGLRQRSATAQPTATAVEDELRMVDAGAHRTGHEHIRLLVRLCGVCGEAIGHECSHGGA